METLTNAANAASRAIFGDTNSTQPSDQSGQEPVSGEMGDTVKGESYDAGNEDPYHSEREPLSGQLGDTSKGEPYDAGNADSTDTDKTTPTTNTSDLPLREKADNTSNMDSTKPMVASETPGNTSSTGPIQPEYEHDKTGVIDAPQPSSGFTSDKPTSSNEPSASGPEPSVSADPSSGVQDTPKQQGADRPEDEPNSDEHKAIQDAKKEAEEAQSVDVSGPGPSPLEERGTAATGGGDDDGPQKESQGEGTGEQYVKSSGMKSDGGDFDAANPGAGKEADRLLEEKGVHHAAPSESVEETGPSEDLTENKKPSLKEKIKAKLHKH